MPTSRRTYLFDLDGTVLDTELLPLIGAELGLERELAHLTRLTMNGVIPFEISFRHRVDLLKLTPISRVRDIVNAAPLNPSIEAFIRRESSRCVIVTGNCDVWVAPIARRLGCKIYSSSTIADGDVLVGVDQVVDKGAVARAFRGEAIAIGDGHNDFEMFRECCYSVAYGGVHAPAPSLLTIATHATYQSASLCRLLQQLS